MYTNLRTKSPYFYISAMALSLAVLCSFFLMKLQGTRLAYSTTGAPLELIDAWCLAFQRGSWAIFACGLVFWSLSLFKKETAPFFICVALAAVFVLLKSVFI